MGRSVSMEWSMCKARSAERTEDEGKVHWDLSMMFCGYDWVP
jgi:hypothetical protein